MRLLICAICAALVLCAGAQAEEENTGEAQEMKITGTTTRIELCTAIVEQEIRIAGSPAQVYSAMTTEMGLWWDREFVMGGAATTDMVLEAHPGGRWMEVWGEGEGFIWGMVQRARKDKGLTILVPEGVIWSGPGSITIDLEAVEGSETLVKIRHVSTQEYSEEDGHSGYVYGWTKLYGENLKKYVETGERMGVRQD